MILGLIEHDRGVLNEISLEMLTIASDLARKLGDTVEAVLIGDEARSLADGLSVVGVSRTHLIRHERLRDYAPDAWAHALLQIIEDLSAHTLLAASTDRGNEVTARVAARAGLPMVANCIEVSPVTISGSSPVIDYEVTRLRWGGSLLEDATLEGELKILTVAPHIIAKVGNIAESVPVINEFTPMLEDDDFRVCIDDRVPPHEGVTLTNAPVVIGGGRGVGSTEGFAVLEELAEVICGAVGCSRAVTNNGWRPHSDQVGQTGVRITPDLYVACGISGAIQHWVGCMGSKKVLAINTDPEAPIISKADYAVIGDLHEVVPTLTAEIRRIKNA
jgi:electron transfer flavoprotein alpha subunit